MQSVNIKISIVTIAFNACNEIEKTIQSVISQSYDNIEYIIIDGGSSDGTVNIIQKYNKQITNWVSEKDSGIYDAMNKGNQLATGEYVMFLNSGDAFTNNSIIEDIITQTKGKIYSLLTGRTKIYYKDHDLGIVSPPKNVILTANSPSFSHQATLIHRSIYKAFSYQTFYAICADKEYWYQVKKVEKFSVLFCDINIASFELGGVSNNHKNVVKRRLEDLYIEYKHNGVNLKSLSKMFIITSITYLITINEDFYYKYIYVYMNKYKNRKR